MDFLTEYHLGGLVLGISTFLIIGIFHPIVIKAEYYYGTRATKKRKLYNGRLQCNVYMYYSTKK